MYMYIFIYVYYSVPVCVYVWCEDSIRFVLFPPSLPTDGLTDRPTDRPTDRSVSGSPLYALEYNIWARRLREPTISTMAPPPPPPSSSSSSSCVCVCVCGAKIRFDSSCSLPPDRPTD